MKKKQILILDLNKNIYKNFIKHKSIIANENIYKLENFKNKYLIPLKIKNKYNIFIENIIKKDIDKIKIILIITENPNKISQFNNEKILNFKEKIIENIYYPIYFINYISKIIIKPINLLFIIHKEEKNKKQFWYYSNCINGSIIYLMKTLNDENKNMKKIFSNCLSTEKVNTLYKKKIYPYKNFKKKKKKNILELFNYIIKNKIKNKIIKI